MSYALSNCKVLMLLDNPFISDNRVSKEAESLVKHGVNLIVLATKHKDCPDEEHRDGYLIIRCIEEGFNAPFRSGYNSLVQKLTEIVLSHNPDVVHCHDFYMLSIGSEVKKKKPEIKLIYDQHEFLPGWPFHKTLNGINRLKGYLVWRKIIRKEKQESANVDAFITINEMITEIVSKNYNLKICPISIGNLPSYFEVKSDPNYFHNKYLLDHSCKIIVHTGNIYQNDKEIKILFETISNIENVCLVMIGNKPRFLEIKNAYEKALADKKKIFFHEYPKTQFELIELVSSGDIGIMHVKQKWLSHEIGTPNRLMEYLAAGIPILSNKQKHAELINDKYDCVHFFNPDDKNSIRRELESLLGRLEEAKSNSSVAFKNLNWENEEKKLIKAYTELL